MHDIAAEHQCCIEELIVDRSRSAPNLQLELKRQVQRLRQESQRINTDNVCRVSKLQLYAQ